MILTTTHKNVAHTITIAKALRATLGLNLPVGYSAEDSGEDDPNLVFEALTGVAEY